MVPGVLSISNDIDRELAVNHVNSEIEKSGGLGEDPYKNSKKMLNISLDILSNQSFFQISYAWIRASIINTIASPFLIDNRVRNMKNSSFAKEGNISVWFTNLLILKENRSYLSILLVSLLFSLISFITFL